VATSSIEQIDIVDSVNGIPASCAARQGENFSVAVLHPAQPDRRQSERQRDRLAKNGCLGAAIGDVAENTLAQRDPLEIGPIRTQRLLRVGARLRIIDKCARYFAVRKPPQILDARDSWHGGPGSPENI
jgi:hypothetical protein